MAKVEIGVTETPEQKEAFEQLEAVLGAEMADRAGGYIAGLLPMFNKDNLAELSYMLGAYVAASQVVAIMADLEPEVGTKAFFVDDNMPAISNIVHHRWGTLLAGLIAIGGKDPLIHNLTLVIGEEEG